MDSQYGDREVAEFINFFRPSRLGERGGITPAVVVEGEEVATLIVCPTVHIMGSVSYGLEVCKSASVHALKIVCKSNIVPMSAAE